MVATLYSDILRQAPTKSFKYGDVQLRDWFRDKALEVSSQQTTPNRMVTHLESIGNDVNKPKPGRMLFYRYDPKHKDTLPYYDTFPLIFPLELYKDGFLGINMHYLPPIYRARLMDALYETISNDRYDNRSKMKINYQILNAAAKMRYFRPCIKRYLYSHVKSPLLQIDTKEWDYVLMLPIARFKKATARKVWDDSVKMINKG